MDNKRYWDGFELPDLQTEGLRLRYYDDESWALCVKQELNLVKWGVALAYRAREKKLSQSDREALIVRFENVVSQTSIVVKNVVDALKTLDENKRLECWQKRDEWKDRLENSVRRWISSDDERYIDEFWPIEKEHYDWFATYDVMLQLNRDAMDKESRQSGKAGEEIKTTPETGQNVPVKRNKVSDLLWKLYEKTLGVIIEKAFDKYGPK